MNDDNIQLLRQAGAAYDAADAERFSACLTADWREYDPSGAASTLDDEREAMDIHRTAFPDKHTEIHRAIADGAWVACHCTTTATHTGRYFDLDATGRTVVVHEMMFSRVENGRLAETWTVTEGRGFYEQLTGRSAPAILDNMT